MKTELTTKFYELLQSLEFERFRKKDNTYPRCGEIFQQMLNIHLHNKQTVLEFESETYLKAEQKIYDFLFYSDTVLQTEFISRIFFPFSEALKNDFITDSQIKPLTNLLNILEQLFYETHT